MLLVGLFISPKHFPLSGGEAALLPCAFFLPLMLLLQLLCSGRSCRAPGQGAAEVLLREQEQLHCSGLREEGFGPKVLLLGMGCFVLGTNSPSLRDVCQGGERPGDIFRGMATQMVCALVSLFIK